MSADLRELADRLALRQLVDSYAGAADRRDGAALASLFTEDGRMYKRNTQPGVSETPFDIHGHEALSKVLDRLSRYQVTTHFVGQHVVELRGNEASGEAYCLAHHLYELEGRRYNRVMSIRYQDQYVRTGGRWQIKERCLNIDWIEYRLAGSIDDAPSWMKP